MIVIAYNFFMRENKFQSQWGIWYTYLIDKDAQKKTDDVEYSDNTQLIFNV